MRIALVGFMGCGKTSIGGILASRLGLPFVDLDGEIEASSGATIAEIFNLHGEPGFRVIEERCLAALAGRHGPFVLACGGGVVLSPANRDVLVKDFAAVWIDVPFAELMKRLAGEREQRPLLKSDDYEDRAKKLFLARKQLYETTAQFTVRWEQGESPEASAAKIIEMLEIARQ